jgi:hypothetical protein
MVDSRLSAVSALFQPSTLNFQLNLARRVGLEPTTNGFGDRYSTN